MTEKKVKKQDKKPLTYQDVANFFLAFADDRGEVITNLKLQKLVYYAQAWFLANYGEQLFEGDFQAWVHGPVLPELYYMYKEQGSSPIKPPKSWDDIEQELDPEILDYLKEVAQVYMPSGAYELELMTHQETPWIEARGDLEPDEKCETVIPLDAMRKFYSEKIKN